MGIDYKCNFDLAKTIKRLGLEERGRVQRFVDSEVMRISSPYVPFLEGDLSNSVIRNTVIGSGEVVYDCGNKARRLYYGEKNWNWSNGGTQNGGLRGPYWVDRAMQNGGLKKIETGVRKMVKK